MTWTFIDEEPRLKATGKATSFSLNQAQWIDMNEGDGKIVGDLLMVSLLGVATALLVAPKIGKENR